LPFPYDGFELAFLQLVSELTVEDLAGEKTGERDLEIAALTGKRHEISDKIATLQERIVGENAIDALIPVLERLECEMKETDEKLEQLKGEAAHQQPAALDEVKTLARLLRDTKGEKQVNLRLKARARIRQLVSEIWMLVWDVTPTIRGAEIQVFFHTGKVRVIILHWARRGRRPHGRPAWRGAERRDGSSPVQDRRHCPRLVHAKAGRGPPRCAGVHEGPRGMHCRREGGEGDEGEESKEGKKVQSRLNGPRVDQAEAAAPAGFQPRWHYGEVIQPHAYE
jgi:hypothetical protein